MVLEEPNFISISCVHGKGAATALWAVHKPVRYSIGIINDKCDWRHGYNMIIIQQIN